MNTDQNIGSEVSAMDWPGLHPRKFDGGRKHIAPDGQILLGGEIQGKRLENKQRKHFDEKLSDVAQYKPVMRQFGGLTSKETAEEPQKIGVKRVDYFPHEKPRRPERVHITAKESGHIEDVANGLKTFEHTYNKQETDEWTLEKRIGAKERVLGLYDKRNDLPVRSLGDKPYRHPDYAPDFFAPGGLVAGSTVRARKSKNVEEKALKSVREAGKLTWKERQKIEERKVEQDALNELDVWVENVLKEANPNYQDPDTFFERLEAAGGGPGGAAGGAAGGAGAKVDPKKDTKKAGKK